MFIMPDFGPLKDLYVFKLMHELKNHTAGWGIHPTMGISKAKYMYSIYFIKAFNSIIIYLVSAPERVPHNVDDRGQAAETFECFIFPILFIIVKVASKLIGYSISYTMHNVKTENKTKILWIYLSLMAIFLFRRYLVSLIMQSW